MFVEDIVIRKCAACGAAIEYDTMMGCSQSRDYWTDGHVPCSLVADWPVMSFVKCPLCAALMWIDELKASKRASLVLSGDRSFIYPTTHELLAVLEKGVDDPVKYRHLRIQVWRGGNDARRKGKNLPLEPFEIDNLQALLGLLDTNIPEDKLVTAEVLRELGRFDQALEVLGHAFEDRYAGEVETLIALAMKKDPFVARMRHRTPHIPGMVVLKCRNS